MTMRTIAARQLWIGFRGALNRRRTEAALSALDDRMLKDIGFSRSDIAWRSRAANMPYGRK